jgi:hypothetical protein
MSAPRIAFLVGGVQKGGTTALARCLAQHPDVRLPQDKEAHVFDAPDFDEAWGTQQIDARFEANFDPAPEGVVYGDATPIYCFHPAFVRRIAAYNPAMRWILILRHPVERAVSHYWMERRRGTERWPFWPAMMLERWRLAGHADDFSRSSPLRRFSYRARGDYARQLDGLYAHFPRDQVLLLRNGDLANAPEETLSGVFRFLGLRPVSGVACERVFEGDYAALPRHGWRRRLLVWLMRRELAAAQARYGLNLE